MADHLRQTAQIILASLAVNGNPTSPYYEARLIGYNASKAALNMLTAQLATELKDTSIVVNSVATGYVKMDPTGHKGFMTPERMQDYLSHTRCLVPMRRLAASWSPRVWPLGRLGPVPQACARSSRIGGSPLAATHASGW